MNIIRGKPRSGVREYLWPRRISANCLCIMYGHEEMGKTPLACFIAAQITRGGDWPDGGKAPKGEVLYIPTEEDHADVCNRVLAMGGDPKKIWRMTRKKFRINEEGVQTLDKVFADHSQIKLMIVDSFKGVMPPGCDTSETILRENLEPFLQLLQRRKVTCIAVMHRRKSPQALRMLHTISGTRGYGALARSAMLIHKEQHEDETIYVMLPDKDSYGGGKPPPASLTFHIYGAQVNHEGKVIDTAVVDWIGETDVIIDDVMTMEKAKFKGKKVRPREMAEAWIINTLLTGPMPSNKVREMAQKEGFSHATIYRAWDGLINKGATMAWDIGGVTTWSLARRDDPPTEDKPEAMH